MRDIANTTTPAADSQPFVALEAQSLAALRQSLQGDASQLSRAQLEHAAQTTKQADSAWLKARGYDFRTKENQQAGIELLSGFSALPKPVLDASLQTVEAINRDATRGLRRRGAGGCRRH